jgi:hypothetical protein
LGVSGCLRIYEEKISGAMRDQPKLARMLDHLCETDVVAIARLDILRRSTEYYAAQSQLKDSVGPILCQMQLVDPAHQSQIGNRDCAGQIVDAAPADPENSGLPVERQVVRAIDHRFALRRPALPSAPDKKSFSSVSSPIFACNVFTSIGGAEASSPVKWSRSGGFAVGGAR